MITITAGSGFGLRQGFYDLVDGKLAFIEATDSDTLVGNSEVLNFDGLTMEEAENKISELNKESRPNDGSHWANWKISLKVEE